VRVPDEVLVIVRDEDTETRDLLAKLKDKKRLSQTPRAVEVETPGTVAALNAGLDVAEGDIIAITDDDAAPRPDWLTRIENHFRSDPRVGGVGGRDWTHRNGRVDDGAREVVGKVRWFGRMISNHQLGVGGSREVDMLKGANSSYRRAAIQGIRFDGRLRGKGAQPYEDYFFSMTVKRAGWRLVYDPAVAVDHYLSPRIEGLRVTVESKNLFDSMAASDRVHNQTLMLLEHFTAPQRLVFALWALLIGARSAYGLVQWLRFFPREGGLAGRKLRAALRGRLEGWKTWRRRYI
jgi:cellulose synthase/poly-beta-1,6-N-acetylglucosamine synthase-like glycosyltransferase